MVFSKKLLVAVLIASIAMLSFLFYWIVNPEFTKICLIFWWIYFWIFIYIFLLVAHVNNMSPRGELIDEHNKSRSSYFDLNFGLYNKIIFSVVTKSWGKKREELLKEHFSFWWLFFTVSILVVLIYFFSSVWDNLLDASNIWYIAPADSGEAFFDVLSRSGLGWNYLILFFLIILLIVFWNFIRKARSGNK